MDVTNLILNLRSKITNDPLDQQMISKAIQQLELGAVENSSSYVSLPVPSSANSGRLYYVDYDGLYWSTGENWVPIVQNSAGVAFGWGCNASGRLGDNTTTNRSSPVILVSYVDWCQVSAGFDHSLGIRSNCTLWAWGANANGRLGDNTTTSRSSPVSVVGGFTDWCQASAANGHSVALRTDGTAWAWGLNSVGQLGNNTTVSSLSPVSVVGGFTDWVRVSSTSLHTLGLRTNGTLWAWGYNNRGQLGDNSIVNKSSPVSVVGGFTDWCQISSGGSHNLAVRTNCTLWAWGCNGNGRLGDNTTISRSSPVSVVGGFTDWCQASAGLGHSLGLRTNGTLWAWGCNNVGRLGDNSIVDRSSPVSVVGGFTDWCQVSAGGAHSLAIKTNGTAWGWGYNLRGSLADDTSLNKSSPVSVVGGFTNWCQISTGNTHSMAIRSVQL